MDQKSPLTEKVAELGGLMHGTRDLELEKELALRLESLPSVEVLSGNIALDKAAREAPREEDFYLTRWRQELAGGVPLEELCGSELEGLSELLQPGRTLLVGEQIGTQEVPVVVGHMACQAARGGLSLALGLSMPAAEQKLVDRYLASAGTPMDQEALLGGRFWKRPYQDGRSSRAMLDLIDRVRALRQSGLPIDLVAYDTDMENGKERDALMAKVWLERRKARPEQLFIVVAGNVHASVSKGTEWDEQFTPMGWHLHQADPSVQALDLGYARGTRWACDYDKEGRLDCRVYGITPGPKVEVAPGLSPAVRLFPQVSPEGFHGLLSVGELKASPPATLPSAATDLPGSNLHRPLGGRRTLDDFSR